MSELRIEKCPHCGAKPVLFGNVDQSFRVMCSQGCQKPGASMQTVIDAWNKREAEGQKKTRRG